MRDDLAAVKMGGIHRGIRGLYRKGVEGWDRARDVLIHEDEYFFCRFDQLLGVWRSLEFYERPINGWKERRCT